MAAPMMPTRLRPCAVWLRASRLAAYTVHCAHASSNANASNVVFGGTTGSLLVIVMQVGKVAVGRRGRGGTLERLAIPRVVTRSSAFAERSQRGTGEEHDGEEHQHMSRRRHEVPQVLRP